jgi:hypothetical protein
VGAYLVVVGHELVELALESDERTSTALGGEELLERQVEAFNFPQV